MTDAESREAARQFYNKWHERGKEDEDDHSYWIDIFSNILGVADPTNHIEFQKKVIVDGKTKRIDAYIPETKVLIEQKSYGIDLDKKAAQSGGIMLTPYEQAKRYNDNLPSSEKVNWIITSNFSEIRIYDMDSREPEKNVYTILLDDIQSQYHKLDILVRQDIKIEPEEVAISKKAGDIIGDIYDALLEQYVDKSDPRALKSLNKLCVRLVFCFYAEDSGIFGRHLMFRDYMKQFDAKSWRSALTDLFRVLDTKPEDRDPYLEDDLAAFPYVNGGLFKDEDIEIPKITDKIVNLIINNACDFDWSQISPTIFGAVFESTLNPETRRSGGMHYTSIENIHKVIDPLLLDDLRAEFEKIKKISVIKTKKERLKKFADKLGSLKFLDPAAGSGNFLTETFLSLRRIENEAIRELMDLNKREVAGQISFMETVKDPIKVSINQFYGIEINDFAVTVATTALWIAEHQMMKQTEDILHANLEFLPLKSYANIVEGNALRLDWRQIVPAKELNYIIGNPPFVGARIMNAQQKADVNHIFSGWKNAGNLDYVSCWYKKSAELMQGTDIRGALVSTNSVTQGEAVANLWKPLFEAGVHFDLAHRTFRWDSESNSKAHVHCVIIGFSTAPNKKERVIYTDGTPNIVNNINGYLLDADNVFIESRQKPICDVPEIGIGNQPIDDGNYLFTEEEMKAFILKEPASEKYFHPWYGSREFINRCPRYCLWLGDCTPAELRKMPRCMERVQAVRDFRLASKRRSTLKLADMPTHFQTENMPESTYIIIPRVSSENRRYIPIGFLTPDVFCSDSVHIIPGAEIYHFGVLTSAVHMAWMRAVCGRLEMRYRYSKDIVYNNFPWPSPSEKQRLKIEQTAKGILNARALYPDSSLADLYDDLTMPPELRRAHDDNNRAVMQAYGFNISAMSEEDCVAQLMRMYQEKVSFVQ